LIKRNNWKRKSKKRKVGSLSSSQKPNERKNQCENNADDNASYYREVERKIAFFDMNVPWQFA